MLSGTPQIGAGEGVWCWLRSSEGAWPPLPFLASSQDSREDLTGVPPPSPDLRRTQYSYFQDKPLKLLALPHPLSILGGEWGGTSGQPVKPDRRGLS